MTYQPFTPNDAFSRSSGQVSGTTVVQKFGRNPDVGTAAFEHTWYNGGPYNWLTGSSTLRVQAGGDAADTSAGAGAREITILGLDSSWNELTETVILSGSSASAPTTGSFLRVNRAFVSKVGTYGSTNVGDVLVETTDAGLVVANIEGGIGQTQLGHYSVPSGMTAYIAVIRLRYSSNKQGNILMYQRQGAEVVVAPFNPNRVLQTWTEFAGESFNLLESMMRIPACSDVWFEAQAISSAGALDVSFDIVLRNES